MIGDQRQGPTPRPNPMESPLCSLFLKLPRTLTAQNVRRNRAAGAQRHGGREAAVEIGTAGKVRAWCYL